MWRELLARDLPAARDGYERLFPEWQVLDSDHAPFAYDRVLVGAREVGGLTPLRGPGPDHWAGFLTVPDCAAAVRTVEEHGGALLVGPLRSPGYGLFAAVTAPGGVPLRLLEVDPDADLTPPPAAALGDFAGDLALAPDPAGLQACLARLAPAAIRLAETEGLPAHALSLAIRGNRMSDG